MLRFISPNSLVSSEMIFVSIHLMLRFIKNRGHHKQINYSFNTSHVTVYRSLIQNGYGAKRGFNTSHVTVYQIIFRSMVITLRCFNTSHVTVYQKRILLIAAAESVSIHLMLRFINNGEKVNVFNYRFQYISCYGLSRQVASHCPEH